MSSNGWVLRAFARPIAVLSAATVIAAGLVGTSPAVAAKPPVAPKSAKTEAEASRLAAQFNTSVEVEDKLTEYTRTVATPQGTLQAEVSNQPVRMRKGGAWVDLDATLETRADGLIAPKASGADVVFSNGGTGPLARYRLDGGVFELKSPWALPKPTLSGSKATYAAVLPGVDLVVNATSDTFSYNLVVQTREAASNPALKALTFPVTTQNLELRTTQPGRPSYVDRSGKQVLSVGEALMWDAASAKSTAGSKSKASSAMAVEEGPSAESKHALMQFEGSAAGLTVKPDQTMLSAADTVFPVVLDPTMALTKDRVGWTAAWELYPGTSFWKTEHSLGVGFEGFEQSKIVRSYYQFTTSYYTNKKIIKASMSAFETHSANCTPKGIVLSRVKPISPRTTWNNQPAVEADVDSKLEAKGWSSACPAGFVEFDVTASIQATSNANLTSTSFRLRASNETDKLAWKQFDARSQLHVEYVALPLPATTMGAAAPSDFADICRPANDPTVVASKQPEVFAAGKVGSGDTSARVYVDFLIRDNFSNSYTLRSGLASPGVVQKRAPGFNLVEGRLYTYNARTAYPTPAGELVSAYAGPCFFKVDTTVPPPPTIKATYKGQEVQDCLTSADPNHCPAVVPFADKVTYTISSTSPDVTAISYGFKGQTLTRVNKSSVTVTLETPNPLEMVLEAKTHDAAEHASGLRSHRLTVGPGLPAVAAWNFDDGPGGTAADSAGNYPLTVTDAEFDGKGRVNGSLLSNGVSSRATVPATFVDTSKNFSISAWARLTGTTDSGVVTITGQAARGGQLRYAANINRWSFIQTMTDEPAQPQARVNSQAPPVMNAWTHLLGVYNAATKEMTLYVNGRSQGTVKFSQTPWKATGRVEVGSVRADPVEGPGIFPGSIDEVKIFQRLVPPAEARELANPRVDLSGSDNPIAALAANYPFDATAGGKTPDTVYGSDLTVSGFAGTDQSAAITEDDDRGKVLTGTGQSAQSVSIGRPLVDATGSFTVLVWVRLADASKNQVIVRQAGTTKDSWRLEYRRLATDEDAQWAFIRTTEDSATGKPSIPAVQATTMTAATEEWTALAAHYDARTDQVFLKLADRSADGSVADFTSPFGTGTTVVGKPPADATYVPFTGFLDDLRVYAGVVPDAVLCTEAGKASCSL
ncbi:DNRLRE domain-containing protein [Kribbella sp. NBC_01505]|uniref:LamG-like jellyroll fold domain-containing protein n=1 Tax=Kribbella sp. NBC_01505 TaxID=2903580 RepID=UPI00387066C0